MRFLAPFRMVPIVLLAAALVPAARALETTETSPVGGPHVQAEPRADPVHLAEER